MFFRSFVVVFFLFFVRSFVRSFDFVVFSFVRVFCRFVRSLVAFVESFVRCICREGRSFLALLEPSPLEITAGYALPCSCTMGADLESVPSPSCRCISPLYEKNKVVVS